MVIKIRDAETREIIGTFSDFISLIWTERFKTYGDFELVTPLTKKHFDLLKIDSYVEIPTSTNLMIIEEISIQDDEDNQHLTVKGKSFESILWRRIIIHWRDVQSHVSLSKILEYIINDNLLSDATKFRRVNWIILNLDLPEDLPEETKWFQTSVNRGDVLGEAIYTLGELFGFCPITTFNPFTKEVYLNFYFGKQTNIIFKHANYNLSNSSYLLSTDNFKTSAFVAGSGEGKKRKSVTVSRSVRETIHDGSGKTETVITFEYNGILRREMFVDARDLQIGEKETDVNYKLRLMERGIEKLKENNKDYVVDGIITNTGKYKLNVDYQLGDIVKVESNFYSATARITEIIQSWSDTGYQIYPSFETIEVTVGDISETYNI
ncbi:MAG: siphovirus ReqiPepy6 Gp37-like family protein, partial [Bacilli bacterium]|nr:siphovirus ReqiPepy6 Gp37-like family protein [Bacilli bacterium]